MNRKGVVFLLFLPLFVVFTSCSQPKPQTQLRFGILAAEKGLWDEAIFRWKKVIQSDPDSSAAHNNLAVAYEKKGLWEEAEKEYELALKLSPNNKHISANYDKFKARFEDSKKEEDKDNKKKDKNN